MKKWSLVFICAFALNFVWENLHSALYANYQNGSITEFILARATLVDAILVTLLMWCATKISSRETVRTFIIIIGGVTIATFIEKWALATGRWHYNALMPVIPLFGTGLTPTIQLGLTGYLIYKFTLTASEGK
jgi:hypothetical protein